MVPLESTFEWLKTTVQFLSSLASLAALVAAAFWFRRTNKAKQRIQFDLDCRILTLRTNPAAKVAEIQFCFENKGFVEHRIYDLTVSVHGIESEQALTVKEVTGELEFHKRLLKRKQLVPPVSTYYFIRPGVRQVITHIVPIDAADSLIRVTAGFKYKERGAYPHTSRRVFPTT